MNLGGATGIASGAESANGSKSVFVGGIIGLLLFMMTAWWNAMVSNVLLLGLVLGGMFVYLFFASRKSSPQVPTQGQWSGDDDPDLIGYTSVTRRVVRKGDFLEAQVINQTRFKSPPRVGNDRGQLENTAWDWVQARQMISGNSRAGAWRQVQDESHAPVHGDESHGQAMLPWH